MKYKKSLFLLLPLLSCTLLLFTGCRSGRYHQSKAAESARDFLIANAPELTPEQVSYVKFNDPVLLAAPVLGEPGGGMRSDSKTLPSFQQQICVTWNIPGCKHLYMVYGVSDNRMFSWHPIRLIKKEFYTRNLPEDSAIAACRSFAVNSLYHSLKPVDLNTIRFTVPWIARTDFELNVNTTGKMSDAKVQEARKKSSEGTQYSLYWFNADGNATVFCGTGNKDLSGWSINFAGHVSKEDLTRHTRAVVRTPDQPDEPAKVK